MTATAATAEPHSSDITNQIVALNYRYVQTLDDRRLDDWPGHFVDDCRYIIHPRENRDRGLEGYWIYCDSKKMMDDRVLSVKEVNLYNIHYDRHSISNLLVEPPQDGVYPVRSNYMVIQTDGEGRSSIFSVGEYRDKVVFVGGEPKFKEKIVIPDTFAVAPLLAIPL